MDITMIGLQNAGKTSLLRVLAVRTWFRPQLEAHPLTEFGRAESSPLSKADVQLRVICLF